MGIVAGKQEADYLTLKILKVEMNMNKVLRILIATIATIGFFLLGLIVTSHAYAGFNFGYDTYATDGGVLILNSTGDQTSSSTIKNLGTNDFIGELAFKNALLLDGYSVAYDANNPGMNPQFSGQYNQVLPIGIALTKLQFAGLSGDPRALQTTYVLTSEYDKLSATGQANSIDTLNTGLTTETTNRINGDNTLQTNINTVDTNSKGRDITLQNNLNTESSVRANADNTLQSEVNDVNNRVDNLSNRVSKLERTQYKLQVGVRILDTKRISVVSYVSQDFTRGCIDEAGVRVTFKLGTSYEERMITATNARVERLEKFLALPEVQEGITQAKMNKLQVVTDGKSFSIKKTF